MTPPNPCAQRLAETLSETLAALESMNTRAMSAYVESCGAGGTMDWESWEHLFETIANAKRVIRWLQKPREL